MVVLRVFLVLALLNFLISGTVGDSLNNKLEIDCEFINHFSGQYASIIHSSIIENKTFNINGLQLAGKNDEDVKVFGLYDSVLSQFLHIAPWEESSYMHIEFVSSLHGSF